MNRDGKIGAKQNRKITIHYNDSANRMQGGMEKDVRALAVAEQVAVIRYNFLKQQGKA